MGGGLGRPSRHRSNWFSDLAHLYSNSLKAQGQVQHSYMRRGIGERAGETGARFTKSRVFVVDAGLGKLCLEHLQKAE
jgi:hypothetical protein